MSTFKHSRGTVVYETGTTRGFDPTSYTNITITRNDGAEFRLNAFWSWRLVGGKDGDLGVDDDSEVEVWCKKHSLPSLQWIIGRTVKILWAPLLNTNEVIMNPPIDLIPVNVLTTLAIDFSRGWFSSVTATTVIEDSTQPHWTFKQGSKLCCCKSGYCPIHSPLSERFKPKNRKGVK